MAYSQEVIRRATARLEAQRADARSQQAQRQQEAYEKLPRLQQIDVQLRHTMAKAAQSVFGGADMAVLEQAKQENLALQAEREALIAANFAPGWLEEHAPCGTCGGTGWIGGAMCQCLKKLCLEEQRKELGSVFSGRESFDSFDLSYYSQQPDPRVGVAPRAVMSKVKDTCIVYARHFALGSGNLMLSGGTGLGKTHLALAIGRAVGEQGYSVCYETAIGLFNKLERARFTPSPENDAQVRRIESCDLLILDDLGTEMPGQFVTAALYGLLNQRLMERKSMVITTNLNVEEAQSRYSPQIASRLYGEFKRLTFLGTDIRTLKSKEF